MQEQAVTIDGIRYSISPVFTVFATQNPVEFEGTYPLPEAQRDRFLMKINIDYPERGGRGRMLDAYASGHRLHDDAVADLRPVLLPGRAGRRAARFPATVRVEPEVQDYILRPRRGHRRHEAVQIGAGRAPRWPCSRAPAPWRCAARSATS